MKKPDTFDLYAKAEMVSSLLSYVVNDLECIRTDKTIKDSLKAGDIEHICLQLWAARDVCDVIAEGLEQLDLSPKPQGKPDSEPTA